MVKREKETHLVFNPGPPRKRKKRITKRKNPEPRYNIDLVHRLEFFRTALGNMDISTMDKSKAHFYLGKIADIVAKYRA
jgi:hypothetical protein